MDSPDYRVGRFILKPYRQLLEADVPVQIGRKALDLLSALAKAEGALVTKDELMAAVWPKAIVEENVIQVHIAALRKTLGKDAELLCTVHGLGYRLTTARVTASPGATSAPMPDAAAAPGRRTKSILVPILTAGLAVIAIVAAWVFRGRLPLAARPGEARVAVLPFDVRGSGGDARGFADGLLDEIVSELSDNQMQVISRSESQALRGTAGTRLIDQLGVDLLLDGTVQSDGQNLNVRVFIEDASEHVSIWSGEFTGNTHAIEALQASVASGSADAMHWAKVGLSGKVRLDAASLAAFVAGRESTTGVRNGSLAVAEADYRKVVAAAPNFTWGHSAIAVTDGFESLHQVPAPGDEARHAEARREARRALELEPHNGEAYTALELNLPVRDWQGREALLLQGTAADPSFEPIVMMEGRLLWVVGRAREALPWLQRAHDVYPLHNGEAWSLAVSLAAQGRAGDSRALVAQMRKHWPDQNSTKDARFMTSILLGATDETLAQLADPASYPAGMDQKAADAWIVALKALSGKDAKAKAQAAKAVLDVADSGSFNHGQAMFILAMLGDLDDAFAQGQNYLPVNPYSPPYLFLPPTAAMRSDPRFMPLARKLGLVDYWRTTGHWPDFCSEPGLPYRCREAANQIAAWHPTAAAIGTGP
jgi:DNA-binding winged helix-turn-helix (wHTH) protein/TolB-like protein